MRLHTDAKTALIRSLPLFADCTSREIAQVASVADELTLEAGRVMAQEFADGHEFVVIIDGVAGVQRSDRRIAKLQAGDFFGEIALLTGLPRTASVVAITRVRALVIEGHAFLRLLEDAPAIRAKVERALAERLPTAS